MNVINELLFSTGHPPSHKQFKHLHPLWEEGVFVHHNYINTPIIYIKWLNEFPWIGEESFCSDLATLQDKHTSNTSYSIEEGNRVTALLDLKSYKSSKAKLEHFVHFWHLLINSGNIMQFCCWEAIVSDSHTMYVAMWTWFWTLIFWQIARKFFFNKMCNFW